MIQLTNDEFDRAIADALAELPDAFRPYLANVIVEAWDRPTAQLVREQDVPDDILGLYIGCPLEDKALEQPAALPDRVLIFRRNLCEMCDSRAELLEEIRITVLHEIGHHFGLDEQRLGELGYD